MKIILYFFLLLLHAKSLADPSNETTGNVIDIKLPLSSNNAKYVKELLTKAYEEINYKINWVDIASSQELELVNSGKLGAAIARSTIIETEFPTLIKVPYKLFDFALLRVSDRRRCGYCLKEEINSIVYPKGARVSVNYAQSLHVNIDKLAISNSEKLNEMILKRRADSVLIMDFQLDAAVYKNPHMIIETISHKYDYHYLSLKYQYLAKPLEKALNELEQKGTVDKLKKKYNIQSSQYLDTPPQNVSFISGKLTHFSNANSSGVYWDVIEKVFSDEFTITKNTSTWVKAMQMFKEKKVDVLVGAHKNDVIEDTVLSSFHLNYEPALYVFARNKAILRRFKDKDSSLSACLDSSYSLFNYISFIPLDNIVEATISQCDILIKNSKIDIVIEYDYILDKYIQALPKLMLIESAPLFLAFHNTPKGHFLKSYFDKNIAELARKGTLKNLFPDELTFKKAHIHR
jgi:ABC-type amino acid transport substrate-binding protein